MVLNLRDLLQGALGAAGLQTTTDVWQLAEVWTGALGARIASKATPVRLVRGELVVAVAEAVWRQELALLAPQIVARLNEAVGRDVVQRLRLIGGDATTPSPSANEQPRRRLPMVSSAAPASARETRADAAPQEPLDGKIDAALRSLAAKRAERVVADDAPSARRGGTPGQASPRKRW
jgi:hypothetical protein